jgi:hypothetical protein
LKVSSDGRVSVGRVKLHTFTMWGRTFWPSTIFWPRMSFIQAPLRLPSRGK